MISPTVAAQAAERITLLWRRRSPSGGSNTVNLGLQAPCRRFELPGTALGRPGDMAGTQTRTVFMSYARGTPLAVGTGCPGRPARHLAATKTQLVAVSGAYSHASGEGAGRQWRTGGRASPSCGPLARDPDPAAPPFSHEGQSTLASGSTRRKLSREDPSASEEIERKKERERSRGVANAGDCAGIERVNIRWQQLLTRTRSSG